MIAAVIAAAVVALAAVIFVNTRPVTVNVNGSSIEVPKSTTYQDLRDDGYLTARAGDLYAIDGSLLEEGGGTPYTTYVNGVEVFDYSTRVEPNAEITDTAGTDETETFTTGDTVTTPFTTTINGDGSFNFYNGVLHLVMTPGVDGVTGTITGDVSGITLTDYEITPMQPRTIESLDPTLPDDQRYIALTFDDGPNPGYTEAILQVLNDNDVKATFFMIGSNVDAYPDLARQVADSGMQVASHSYIHEPEFYLNKLSDDEVREQLTNAQNSIYNATGVTTTIVRPPGGNMTAETYLACGDNLVTCFVGWDLGTGDFNRPGVDYIVDQVLTNAHPGAIVLMHDGGGDRSQTAEALAIIIPALKEQGYQFVTIDELIEIRRAQG